MVLQFEIEAKMFPNNSKNNFSFFSTSVYAGHEWRAFILDH